MAGQDLVACICEGIAEKVIMNKLLDEDRLIFGRNDLLDREILKCKTARDFEDKYLGKGFNQKIKVYRILDSKQENFKLRRAYKDKVEFVDVVTAPEIEMLVIINEGMHQDYLKYKSKVKPSDYCIQHLGIRTVKSDDFLETYFADVNTLVTAIKTYKSLHKLSVPHGKKFLADLLK